MRNGPDMGDSRPGAQPFAQAEHPTAVPLVSRRAARRHPLTCAVGRQVSRQETVGGIGRAIDVLDIGEEAHVSAKSL